MLNYEYQRSSILGATETEAEPLKELEKESKFGEQIEVIKWDPELINVFTTEEKKELVPELMNVFTTEEKKELVPKLMNAFTAEEKKELAEIAPELRKYLP